MNRPPPSSASPRPAHTVADLMRGRFGRLIDALEARGASAYSLGLILLCGLGGYLNLGVNGIFVLILIGVLFFEFQKRLDQGLPLMQMAALLAGFQWCLGPFLAYSTDLVYSRYVMYVDEGMYFSFALPGTALFAFGLLAVGSSVKQRGLLRTVRWENFQTIGIILALLGFGARLASGFVPGGLAFAVFLTSQLSYVAVLYFMFSRRPHRWWWIGLTLLPTFRQTAESAMFHDLLLWAALLFCYWYGMRKHTLGGKFGMLAVMGLVLFSIQSVKESYRLKVWNNEEASFFGEVVNFWSTAGEMSAEEVLPNVIMRLNQGWIISAVMRNVPEKEPFADGETVVNAFAGAFVPRFIWASKAKSGGQENFRRFTGLSLEKSTSMAISPLGEAYANFGRDGGILLMLGFGLSFSLIYSACLRWTLKRPDFLFWIPLIFYQAIKAETEFVTVLNQVSKGAVIAFGFYWLICRQVIPELFPLPPRRRRELGPGGGPVAIGPPGGRVGEPHSPVS